MGWSDCGTDSEGRPIGYAFKATCDHPGCDAEIDRRLPFACGDMHGDTEYGCEKYFCRKHLLLTCKGDLCPQCAVELCRGRKCNNCSKEG